MVLERKLIRNGNSWAMTINKTILEFLDVDPEVDMVRYILAEDKLLITKSNKKNTMTNKILLLLSLLITGSSVFAYNTSAYYDKGLIYSATTFPQSVEKCPQNFNKLKKGQSSSLNILGLIETGNASINKAAKDANITKIHFVDTQINKVYIPFLFIPIYAKETKTIIYGE